MDDAGAMRGGERLGNLYRGRQRGGQWERPAFEARGQRLALNQFHHEEVSRPDLVHSVQRGDMGMVEGGECLRLAREASNAVWVAGHRIRQNLDRNGTPELRIVRAIDLAHGPGAERGKDFVGAEARAGG